MKKYKVGMYGGKFMPMHKGHEYCVELAAKECETVYVILFYGGEEEERILGEMPEDWLSVEARKAQLKRVCEKYSSIAKVIPAAIDCGKLRKEVGNDTWDAETPLVRALVGDRLDAVYGSEEAYGKYFKRAYPEAVYRLVDVNRELIPISGTLVRKMKREDREKWMV